MTADIAGEVRRRPRQQRSADKVGAILAATRALLTQRQPHEITARDIATAAGLSPATVYRYFRDVDAVVDALLVEHAQVAEGTVSTALAASTHRTVAGVFEHVAHTYLRLYRERPDLTVAWRSEVLAERHRRIEAESDRSLAVQLSRHLIERRLVDPGSADLEWRLVAHWQAAGVLLGVSLRAEGDARRVAEGDLVAFVRHAATRLR